MREFIEQIQLFRQKIDKLNDEGFRKKDIASHIGIPASVLSSMQKTVFPRIIKLHNANKLTKESMADSFALVNNMSEKKVIRELPQYLNDLDSIGINSRSKETQPNFLSKLKYFGESSFENINCCLTGLYECFYLSSLGYRVKREPLLIKASSDGKTINVYKGNDISNDSYIGMAYLVNNSTLTIQFCELHDIPTDLGLMHLHLPVIRTPKIISGMYLGMSCTHFPIARKVVLRKVTDQVKMEDYHRIETVYYNSKEECESSFIYDFVSHATSAIENIPIPHPTFTEEDLGKELQLIQTISPRI